jgi:thiol:disulfide interchange protein DsbC
MKKHIVTLISLACALLLPSTASADSETIRKSILEKMPNTQIRSITKTAQEGLYEVIVNGTTVFYTDAKGQTGFFGKMVDLRTRTDLTEKRVQELMVVDFSSLPLDKAIVSVRGDGSRKLAVFSDPDCPYCKQLDKDLESITNVTVYTFLLPLISIHPDAKRKAELILCAADPAKTYRDWMVNGTALEGSRDCATPLAEIAEFSKKIWLQGTPGMIFASGKLVPGAIPRHQIEAMLDASKAAAQSTAR